MTYPVTARESGRWIGNLNVLLRPKVLEQIVGSPVGLGPEGHIVVAAVVNSTHFTVVMPPLLNPAMFGAYYRINDSTAVQSAVEDGGNGFVSDSTISRSVTESFELRCAFQTVSVPGTNIQQWIVMARVSAAFLDTGVTKLKIFLLAGIGSMVLVVFLVSLPFIRALAKPILELTRCAQKLTRGDLTARAPVPRQWFHDEISQLMVVFNLMAKEVAFNLID